MATFVVQLRTKVLFHFTAVTPGYEQDVTSLCRVFIAVTSPYSTISMVAQKSRNTWNGGGKGWGVGVGGGYIHKFCSRMDF